MTPYVIDVHPEVVIDYVEAYNYYEQLQVGLGDKLLEHVRLKLETISHAPETYGNKGKKGYREAIVDNFPYLIIYKVYPKNKRVFISAIHHAKMSPGIKYRK